MEENQKNELVSLYISECDKLLNIFEKIIMNSDTKDELTDTAELFRTLHTLKGSSATMEYTPLADLSHHFESILSKIKKENITPSKEQLQSIIDVGISFSSYFRTQLTHIKTGHTIDENDDLSKLLNEISISFGEASSTASVASSQTNPEKESDFNDYNVYIKITLKKCPLAHIRAFITARSIIPYCSQLTTIPKNLDKATDMDEDILKNGFIIQLVPSENSDIGTIIHKLSTQPFVTSCTVIKNKITENPSMNNTDVSSNVMVEQSTVNSLIHYMDELVSKESSLEEFFEESGLNSGKAHDLLSSLKHTLREAGILTSEIGTRSINSVFMQMQLTVRTISKELNKKIKVQLFGADTQVDKSILETLSDSLIHIIRNSVDHGIEMPEERKTSEKPEFGTIIISASKKNDYLTVTVADDGRGINHEAVLEEAAKMKLLKKPREKYTAAEVGNLLLSSSISTKNVVTKYSGRGVGLNTVVRRINQVGGKVSVESLQGKGTTFTIKIPISLTIIDGIEITTSSGSQLVIPTNAVLHISSANKINKTNNQIEYSNITYKQLRFPEKTENDNINGFILFLTSDFGEYFLNVNEISIMKSYYLKALPGCITDKLGNKNIYSGCVMCTDSKLRCVLDVEKLIAISELG